MAPTDPALMGPALGSSLREQEAGNPLLHDQEKLGNPVLHAQELGIG